MDTRLSKTLVTGATGFVGSALCSELARVQTPLRRVLRDFGSAGPNDIAVGDIGPNTDWRAALQGISSVIHLAGRAHVMRESASNPLAAYRETNVAGTRRLAEAAAEEGVKRFIFLSSIKVNGERTGLQPFRETDEPRPEDAYGISKLEAERELNRIAAGSTTLQPAHSGRPSPRRFAGPGAGPPAENPAACLLVVSAGHRSTSRTRETT